MTTEIQLAPLESQLQKFEVTTESLEQMVAPMKDLKIIDLDDKEGYLRVREARLKLKGKRVEIEKTSKALRDDAVKFQKAVIAREKEFTSILTPEEERLASEEQRWDEWKEQERKEAERKEAERVQHRIIALAEYGWGMDLYLLTVMSDEEFNKNLELAKEDHAQKQAQAEAERIEKERLRAEEEERMRQERTELERQKAEQLKREQELEAERRELQRQQIEKDAAIKAEQERQRKEYEAQQAELRRQREEIEAEKRRIAHEEEKKAAAERGRLAEIERAKIEEEARIERERQAKIEAERQEAIRPDKDKFKVFALGIRHLQLPDVKSEGAKQLNSEVQDFLVKLADHIDTRVKSL